MGAEKLSTKVKAAKFPDYDKDPEARHNLISIINENARVLYAPEVAWFLGKSISEVYATVPRIEGRNDVRFDPPVIQALKGGSPIPLARSVKTEEKKKSSGLSKTRFKGRKEKVPLCLS